MARSRCKYTSDGIRCKSLARRRYFTGQMLCALHRIRCNFFIQGSGSCNRTAMVYMGPGENYPRCENHR